MSNKKRRKLRPESLIIIAILSALIILGVVLLTTNFAFVGKKSIHADAKTYKTRHCLVFYPDSNESYKYAKNLCKGVKDDSIHDYSLIPYGDYYQVSYGGDNRYFTDRNFNAIAVSEVSDQGKKIIFDYIRYTYKKDYPDKYYNADFISSLTLDSIDFTNVTYSIDNESLVVNIPQHEMDVRVPLKYMQQEINMNFGFENQTYVKPTYLDTDEKHPIICITFDDGPHFWYEPGDTSTEKIVNLLYKYDATGTFYCVGTNLENRETWTDYQAYNFLKNSISQGNEYGSHTQTHLYTLTNLSTADQIKTEINGPIDYMQKFLGYKVNTYRPVSGEFDDDVLNVQPVGAILWDVDSEDWLSLDVDTICDRVLSAEYETGDIIIMHDIYDETAEALETIIPELINRGCQLVTVSEMFRAMNIDVNNFSYYYGPTYYE